MGKSLEQIEGPGIESSANRVFVKGKEAWRCKTNFLLASSNLSPNSQNGWNTVHEEILRQCFEESAITFSEMQQVLSTTFSFI
jgi:hypothetical protein